ncbi:MAG: hypothetical protein PHE89_06460 [Alphaproteobacteria bacterium]|nr:hypothetical protein [Alphaproteobacteria bacterium]
MKKTMLFIITILGMVMISCSVGQMYSSYNVMRHYKGNPRVVSKQYSEVYAEKTTGNYFTYFEWDNAIIQNEEGFIVLYTRAGNGQFLFTKEFARLKKSSHSFNGEIGGKKDKVKIISSTGGAITVNINGKVYYMMGK